MDSFLRNKLIGEVGAPVALGSSTDQNSDRLDMKGWEGVVFFVAITDSVATGVATLTIEQNIIDSDSGMAALTDAVATATCAINDDLNDQLLAVDVPRPQERYIQGVITSGTANIAFGNTYAIRYGARKYPVSIDDTVLDSAIVVSPDES